jgi:anhydro-N-acetylmuramic acid kinase
MLKIGPINVLGLMSGTSMDGTDLAICSFLQGANGWKFELLDAKTFEYPTEWSQTLNGLMHGSAHDFAFANAALGRYYGNLIREFIAESKLKVDLIGSHGHTIFHQPQLGFTSQIGDGAQIAAITGIDTICDFRSKDVALGGQGAPLVPVGDAFLFADYTACLNLGGIANISFNSENGRKAFDICPVNMVLNKIALSQGLAFDMDGKLAAKGEVDLELLNKLNNLSFYNQTGPKSLGKEWFDNEFFPVIGFTDSIDENSACNLSRTMVEHIAIQLTKTFESIDKKGSVLVTGGGAFHKFLIDRIAARSEWQLILPSTKIINYKEAIVFGFLATLNYFDSINIFNSATGALRDSIGGAIYKGR